MSEKSLCIWLNQKGNPCPWQACKGKYCKRHSIYDGVFAEQDIPNLRACSGCKNMFKPEEEIMKICNKCKERGTINRIKKKEAKITCLGMTQKQTPCTFKCMPGDTYCEKHQSFKRWKQLTDAGENVCKNWIRGCFENTYAGLKSCKNCRDKEQTNENKLNQNKRLNALNYNDEKDEKNIMCVNCNSLCDKSDATNDKCLKCYNAYCKVEQNRNPRSDDGYLVKKIIECKKNADRRKIEWKLSDQFAIQLFQSKCSYCNSFVVQNGIDRIDSSIDYIENNCVACCKHCNIMKASHSVTDFLKIVQYLLAANGRIDQIPDMNHARLFHFAQNASYARFVADSTSRQLNCEITDTMYEYIISQPCFYCKNQSSIECKAESRGIGARGIDRLDATVGYVCGNFASCCKTCNMMKNTMSVADFFVHLQSVYDFRILMIHNTTQSISDQIKTICTDVKSLRHEKFFQTKEFYDKLTFGYNGGCNLENVSRIQAFLEIVETKEQRDIWNYFRRNVSSLKKTDSAKLIGRQIHILVKDLTTNLYLGIISLSSDVYNLDQRDKYIGWDFKDKASKLKHILNITTCVPLQPFGYNFNGGKLIAALAFSLEIATHFREKYDDSLLAIITTSLYGKSIQYDRLPFLQFIGYTKGNSVMNIPSDVTKICADFLKKEFQLDYPLRKKFIIVQKAFDKLGISKEDFLQSTPKGIYFGYTCNNAHDMLTGKTPIHISPKYNQHVKPAQEICQWWIGRWAIQRFNHLTTNQRLN